MEEHTTYCPSCAAPQIKVTSPDNTSAGPPPLAPELAAAPDSIQLPLASRQVVLPGRIQWGKSWRVVLLPSVFTAAALILLSSLGLGLLGPLVFVLGVMVAVNQYQRRHPMPLRASQGAVLGAFAGLLTYLVVLIYSVPSVASDPREYRRAWLQNLQQKMGTNPDPQIQAFARWAATDQGLLVLSAISLVILAVFVAVISGVIGSLTASLSRRKRG